MIINQSLLKIMMTLMYSSSILMAISSKSLFLIWICLEFNILAFVSMSNNFSYSMSNSLMKYFIIQSLSSYLFLFCGIMLNYMNLNNKMIILMMYMSMMVKLGIFPFSPWYFQISQNMNWMNWFLLNSFQKMTPLWVISFNMITMKKLNFMIILNSVYSLTEIWNQTSIRWMINASSLNHINWMLLSMNSNYKIWDIYFMFYCVISFMLYYMLQSWNWNSLMNFFNKNNQTQHMLMSFIFMNFMGVPPFLGFLPKLMIMSLINTQFITLFLILINILFCIIYFFYMMPNLNLSLLSKTQLMNNKTTTMNYLTGLAFFLFFLFVTL